MVEIPIHGGDLAHAKKLVRDPVDSHADWVDLSTGINPTAYEIGEIPGEIWNRLPDAKQNQDLLNIARKYYRVPDGQEIIAAPGSQAVLQLLPKILDVPQVQIVGPTYGGHRSSWAKHGRCMRQIERLEQGDPGAVVIVVHPNNPTGSVVESSIAIALARQMKKAGGTLIVDEAFCDCLPDQSLVPHMDDLPVLILKSVGKYFGLAGMRLGFAIGGSKITERISAQIGDWPVSGPALYGGAMALADHSWQQLMRVELDARRALLDTVLSQISGNIIGQASLFALLEFDRAELLFSHLLRHHIYVRAFAYDRNWLRIGLPKNDADFARLVDALARFKR